jgi:chromatin remodeling complex protein RSC6
VKQDLDTIGEEHMEKGEMDAEQDNTEYDAASKEEGDSKLKAIDKKRAPETEESDSEEEEEVAPSASLIGKGDWEDH